MLWPRKRVFFEQTGRMTPYWPANHPLLSLLSCVALKKKNWREIAC